MKRDLNGAVVVVTGASSGIGRVTAHEFAARGANLVLAARREDMLEEAAAECRRLGAGALAVNTDVTDPAAMEQLCRRAVERFGHVDVWVNNAGIYHVGKIEDLTIEDIRRVIDVNLLGTIFGARVAVTHFRRRGHGVIINVASLDAREGRALHSVYAASKYGVRGFSEALRQELFDAPDIHVCAVEPAQIDTPLWHHAINRTGHRLQAPPPVYDPVQVARAIADLAERPRREVLVGGIARLTVAQKAVSPWLADRVANFFARRLEVRPDAAPPTTGNAFQPMHDGMKLRGGWRAPGESHAVRNALLATGAVAAGVMLARSRRNHRPHG